LTEEAAEVEGLAGNGRCVHGNSRAPKATSVAGWKRQISLIINKLRGTEPRKTGHVCLVCPCSPVKGAAPLIPWYGWGRWNSGGGGGGARRKWLGRSGLRGGENIKCWCDRPAGCSGV
jgi:hypothetical protein